MTDTAGRTLTRSLGPTGVALLTLSVLSPAASVFISGSDIIHQVGTGAALAFLLGGLLTLTFTFAQAELGSTFPVAGGNYAIVGHALGPAAGAATFGIDLLGVPVFIALSATGIAEYLRAVVPGLPAVPTAIVALAVAVSCAILNIRTSALITGTFLAIELCALALVAALGFAHPAGSMTALLHPVAFSGGTAHTVPIALFGLAVAAGSWATSGAGQAIYFSEELRDSARVGRLVMQISVVAILTMVVPLVAMVASIGPLPGALAAQAPFADFVAAATSPWVATVFSLAIATAVFNACMAAVICYGRWIYSSGRDGMWAAPVNRALVRIHPRFGSPWVATMAIGVAGLAFCFLGLRALVILAAAGGIANWTMINLACLAGRRRGLTGQSGTYRAPLWPLTPLLSLAACAVLAVLALRDPDTGRPGVMLVAAMMTAMALYHRFVLARRPGGWGLVNPNAAPQPA